MGGPSLTLALRSTAMFGPSLDLPLRPAVVLAATTHSRCRHHNRLTYFPLTSGSPSMGSAKTESLRAQKTGTDVLRGD